MDERKKTETKNTLNGASKTRSTTDTTWIPESDAAYPVVKQTTSSQHHHSHHSHSRSHSHSHHHRHHHHHHRHHGGHSSKRKNNKFLQFLKKNRSLLINILSCTVSVVLLLLFAAQADFKTSDEPKQTAVDYTQSTLKVETSIYPEKVLLVSEAIDYYMGENTSETAAQVYRSFDGYQSKLNEGVPLKFTYGVTGIPAGVDVQSIELEVSENETYTDSRTYTLKIDESSIDLFNLKTGTTYYYRVLLTLSNDCALTTTGSFATAASPRILNVEGAVNVRDIGGWQTASGKPIKQGLVYRGSELDGAVQTGYAITDRGLQQMIGELGVRFDMDLRAASENKSGVDALGKNVLHKYYGVGMYSDLFNDKKLVKEIFTDLANSENYPVYVHCTHGRDRTGSVCYLLEALLGVSDADLLKEYELSAFTDSYVNMAEFTTFTERVQSFKGDTTQQKVENYLLSVGVTKEQIKTIKHIFLGE